MVDTSRKVEQIVSQFIEKDKYFTINRARQYGKSTMLTAIRERLKNEYYVLSISFEWAETFFKSDYYLADGFVKLTAKQMELIDFPEELRERWTRPLDKERAFLDLDDRITELCQDSPREIILMIDEIDKAADNELIMLFLGLLRDKYIRRSAGMDCTFKSVILAGVYDVKNLKIKIRDEVEHRFNSPWNIAANFKIEMSFSAQEIADMLLEYRKDHGLSFDQNWFGGQIYDYTSGYPYLVSRICEILDTEICYEDEFGTKEAVWTQRGLRRAVKVLQEEENTLSEDLVKKLDENADLKKMVYRIVIKREMIPFTIDDSLIQLGVSFGWFRESDGKVMISNRIFETRICNKLIQEQSQSEIFRLAGMERFRLKSAETLNMDLIVERFAIHYKEIYGKRSKDFLENEARLIFLSYLKPVINGDGNYYQESETADSTRTDIIIDYHSIQYVVEVKIWHGESYEEAGREQLCGYLERYNLSKGWLISFCFNKNKDNLVGIKTIEVNGKVICEAVV
ncbi:MAG: ATP-binding protein [Lachnospiraceae bacterium]|nr:ATP-binding protein [Lachnospiraceae bacterium]